MRRPTFNNSNGTSLPYHIDNRSTEKIYKYFDKIHSIMKHFSLARIPHLLCSENIKSSRQKSVQLWPKQHMLSLPCFMPTYLMHLNGSHWDCNLQQIHSFHHSLFWCIFLMISAFFLHLSALSKRCATYDMYL